MVELYKDGNCGGIKTNEVSETAFLSRFSELVQDMMDRGKYRGDWGFQLCMWMSYLVDICIILRKTEYPNTDTIELGDTNVDNLVGRI